MSNDKRRGKRSGARALILGASLSTIAIAGATTAPRAESEAERACAALINLRSPFTVERVIRRFPDDPCIPVMLSALDPGLLARLDPRVISDLSPAQLRAVPKAVLDMIGTAPGGGPFGGSTRAINDQYY